MRTTPRHIDIHCHLGIPEADAIVQQVHPGPPPGINDFACPLTLEVSRRSLGGIASRLNGLEERLADMERLGIDVQVVSPSPGQFYYHVEPDLGREAARTVNDGIAAAIAEHPDRFAGMGTVPLQDTQMAVAEMRRCRHELGLRGIEISSNVRGRDLHAEELRPFFAAAEEMDMPLFLHPLGFTHGERMRDYYFNNLIGNPLESALAVGHLIFGGVLHQHPHLRICVAHGGGFLASYWGRLDHGWHAREDCRVDCPRPPSSYLRQLWFDTLVFDPQELDALIRSHGIDRLCLGTDYPFDMAEPDPVGFLAHLPEPARSRLAGGNAADLFGIPQA
ncbi:amidohydrolase family protein [Sphingomonas sp.]|uniref:amidohydrolase family protein n=1 Tax=Sphingomonas sp. TaxID=28214 RepID=UPI0031D7DFE1